MREDDCRLLWEWANDPRVRAVSFSSEPILWTQHLQWFRSKLGDPRCIFYIATNSDDMPVGQVRYDLEGDEALVSVSLDRKFCGQGYGSTLIRLSAQKVFDITTITTIHAYVKQGNEASVRAFEKAGYRSAGTTVMGGQQALHLTLSREELKVKS